MQNQTPSKTRIASETAELLREAWRLVRAGGAKLGLLILLSQLVILGVALPVISWLFREALRAGGMSGLDLGGLGLPGASLTSAGLTLSAALIVAIITVAFWMLSLQFAAIVVLLRWPGAGWRELAGELGRVARKLLRPSSAPLVLYLFLLLPLTGYGFMSTLTQGIAIPHFVSGELLKSPSSAVGLGLLTVLLLWLNLRLSPMVPVFVLTAGGRTARSSWRLTRGPRASLPIVFAVTAVLLVFGAVSVALLIVAFVPTAIADALAPDASPVVAAFSLGIAQVIGFLVGGFATAAVSAVLIARVLRGERELAPGVHLVDGPQSAALASAAEGDRAGGSAAPRRTAALAVTLATLMSLGFGISGLDTMQRLSEAPQSYVLAHRGFSEGGVENTIGGLDAAHAVGADFVEMDVMQTKDGGFVAFHDATLSRLADRPEAVKDLTLAELAGVPVHDQYGNRDRIPEFAEYVRHAQRIGMPLLIEIKLSGAETPDHVDRLVELLEQTDALEQNIYHSLDASSIARLKQLRPDLTVGYTMAFAAVAVPDTPADFIVVEEWTATEGMQQSAHDAGLGFMVWTVNGEPGMREVLRRNVDGIVTDHPDAALQMREEMGEETGLSDVLVDALTRFVTVV